MRDRVNVSPVHATTDKVHDFFALVKAKCRVVGAGVWACAGFVKEQAESWSLTSKYTQTWPPSAGSSRILSNSTCTLSHVGATNPWLGISAFCGAQTNLCLGSTFQLRTNL